jgi:hypothetical protein
MADQWERQDKERDVVLTQQYHRDNNKFMQEAEARGQAISMNVSIMIREEQQGYGKSK